VAVADAVAAALPETGRDAVAIKWPNDVLLDGRKVAGILAEGRPQERWAVLGVGLNVAVDLADLPEELRATAATMGRAPQDVEPVLASLLAALERRLQDPPAAVLAAWEARDALRGREVAWAGGQGVAAGIDGAGRLVVELSGGGRTALDAGEVHLGRVDRARRGAGRARRQPLASEPDRRPPMRRITCAVIAALVSCVAVVSVAAAAPGTGTLYGTTRAAGGCSGSTA
jgi:BirA family biotin operon repressor/biotin-[acetyl-CoA-carboxylase] ligase